MVTKKASIRVHHLAKEIGVSSKDIVSKCTAEGIPDITNHMSTISLGLSATIHEWFGDAGASHTAVEVADKVDIDAAKARVEKKTRKPTRKDVLKKESDEAARAQAAEAAERVARAVAAQEAEAKARADHDDPVDEVVEIVDDDGAVTESAELAEAQPNVPDRPDVVVPAGPMLEQPGKTSLTGPRVVRVEAPDPVGPIRRAPPPSRGPGSLPPVQPAAADPGLLDPTAPPGTDRGRGGRNKRRTTGQQSLKDGGRVGRTIQPAQGKAFNWREQDLLERERRLNKAAGFIRSARRDNMKRSASGQKAVSAALQGGTVRIEEPIIVKTLSELTGVKVRDIIQGIMQSGGDLVNADAVISAEVADMIMLTFNIELDVVEKKTAHEIIVESFLDREMTSEESRSPVVTILGHVDHGKTTLLDGIRETKVVDEEAGGITQATSAFRVPLVIGNEEHLITFIDTPGHEAFSEMRARGARVTDLVVLVVAADDGVMPQTIESISHAQAAEVPIIVALNKTDKPEATDANIQRILGQLAEHGLNPVEWGGETEVVPVSAINKEGIQELLEIIDYQAQLLELTADFAGPAEGTVLEAEFIEGKGPVARILVQQGLLEKGQTIVVGRSYGRVRDMTNDHGRQTTDAGPSQPIAISGLNEIPDAGDRCFVVKDVKEAERATEERKQRDREKMLATETVTLDNILEKISAAGRKELPLIVKADVQGSMETLNSTLSKIGSDEVKIAIKHGSVGGVNDSDLALAEATGSIILGFNVTAPSSVRKHAEEKRVDIRYYDVIYNLIDDVTRAAEGLLDPEVRLEVLGQAEVREVFKISRVGMIAGCYVTSGRMERDGLIRVTRDDIVIENDRRFEQLKRFKDDVREVQAGQECGMRIAGYDDIHVGDVLECYSTQEVRRSFE